jgi:hypothetical protein
VGAEKKLNLITQAELARQLEISKQAVQDAKRRGAIKMVGTKVDLDSPMTKEYVAESIKRRDERREKREKTGESLPKNVLDQRLDKPKKPKSAKKKPGPKGPRTKRAENSVKDFQASEKSPKRQKSAQKVNIDADIDADGMFDTKRELEKDLLRQRKLNLELKTKKERGQLIDRELVKAYDAKSAAIDAQELLTLGQRISANLAAAFGKDDPKSKIKAKTIVDKEVFGAIEHKKRMREDFLKSIKGVD